MATDNSVGSSQEWSHATQYGCVWLDMSGEGQNVTVTRMAEIHRSNGTYKILGVASTAGEDKLHEIEVYFSPTGRIRVWKEGKELR